MLCGDVGGGGGEGCLLTYCQWFISVGGMAEGGDEQLALVVLSTVGEVEGRGGKLLPLVCLSTVG